MVQIDVPAAFIVSQLMLDLGKNAIKTQAAACPSGRPAIYYRFLSRSLLFAGAVIAPAGIYLLAGWPGWEQIYWTEAVERVIFQWGNAMIPAMFVLAIVLAGYFGHVLGYYWLVSGKERYLRPTYIIILLIVCLVVLLNYPAFLLMGTYQEYHHNRQAMAGVWQNAHNFSIAWFLVMLYFCATFIYLAVRTRKEIAGAGK